LASSTTFMIGSTARQNRRERRCIGLKNSILGDEDRVPNNRFQYADSDAALDCYSPKSRRRGSRRFAKYRHTAK
jgi:hypothetical protein